MTGEKRSKSTFLETIAVLAIPAVIYLMGYVYWDKYFSCFGIELVKVNLPVYKVMIGATPGVYVVVLAGLLVYFVGRSITRNSAGYDVPTTVLGFIVAVLVIASTLALKRQPKPSWWEPTIYGATCFVGLVAIAWTLDHFTIVKKASIRKFVKRVLTLRIPGLLGWVALGVATVLLPIAFLALESFAEIKAQREASKLLDGSSEKCSFVKFRFSPDAGSYLPDSLILIASSESHYFVFSRPDTTDGKPRRVFAVNRNSVSYIEIRSPEKHESAEHKGSDQPSPPD